MKMKTAKLMLKGDIQLCFLKLRNKDGDFTGKIKIMVLMRKNI